MCKDKQRIHGDSEPMACTDAAGYNKSVEELSQFSLEGFKLLKEGIYCLVSKLHWKEGKARHSYHLRTEGFENATAS